MNENLMQIPQRIRELREILGMGKEAVAERVGVSVTDYEAYESGESDIPISALYELAAALGVDMSVLLFGDEPRMNTYTVMRAGQGVPVERYEGYSFQNLAFNFKNRTMEPMIVTIEPDIQAAPVTHGGQEFNLVLQGTVKVVVGASEHLLAEGDSIYFNAHLPHAQIAVDQMARFLTVIQE